MEAGEKHHLITFYFQHKTSHPDLIQHLYNSISFSYFIDTPCWSWAVHPFVFRPALILHDIYLTECWKHSEISVHIGTTASHSRCRLWDVNLPFHHIPKELYWKENVTGDCGGHLSTVNSVKPVDLSFVTLCHMEPCFHILIQF